LEKGAWSPWLKLHFLVPGGEIVCGLCRFKAVEVSEDKVELYASPVQCAPEAPYFPLTTPPEWAAELAAGGPFPTAGLAGDQTALAHGCISPETFLEDAYHNWDQQAQRVERLLQQADWDLFIAHFFVPDSIQHMFWRQADPNHPAHDPADAHLYGQQVTLAYQWADHWLSRFLQFLDEETAVIVMSDHGASPLGWRVHLNNWLWEHGYLRARERSGEWVVDESATVACCFGYGGLFFNLQGREPHGLIAPGHEQDNLAVELRNSLLAWRDAEGRAVFRAVWVPAEKPAGPWTLPDLAVAFQRGYGLSQEDARGSVAPPGTPLIELNRGWWSGGHEGPYLPGDIPGIVLVRAPGIKPGTRLIGARLIDLAPTILCQMGAPALGMDGQPLSFSAS